jgi:hypothetical protein
MGMHMDLHLLLAERERISDQFRSTFACLSMLRAQLIRASTDEARQHLQSAINEYSTLARDLGDKLRALDASALELQTRDATPQRSPLLSAPLDF